MAKQNQSNQLKSRRQLHQHKNIQINKLKELAKKKTIQRHNLKKESSKISNTRQSEFFKQSIKKTISYEALAQFLSQSTFQCPICLQLLVEPRLLQCGHTYCEKCIEELMIYKSNCGVCRNHQSHPEFQNDKFLERLMDKMIIKKSNNYLDYLCRITDTQNWKNARNIPINQLQVGLIIDFRDRNLKWRKGEISEIKYTGIKSLFSISIKYKHEDQIMIQTIQSTSGRYARHRFYTKMKYLELKASYSPFQQNLREQFINTPLTQTFQDFDCEFSRALNDEQSNIYSQNHSEFLENHQPQEPIENYLNFNCVLKNEFYGEVELIELLI